MPFMHTSSRIYANFMPHFIAAILLLIFCSRFSAISAHRLLEKDGMRISIHLDKSVTHRIAKEYNDLSDSGNVEQILSLLGIDKNHAVNSRECKKCMKDLLLEASELNLAQGNIFFPW